ncbi:hypothetical protein SAY87_001218 [Trapa incisa]|uniref:Ribosomal protein L34Ae n=1 Tax=Trapa incisa TaxID=236973 RepID=A0AAN7GUY7_9MYRT|nr:hypothetical protein SAY87_001218 [Trapa incisa]
MYGRNFRAVCGRIVLLASSFWVCRRALFLPLFHALRKSVRCEEVEDPLRSSAENQGFTVDERENSGSMNSAPVEAAEPGMVDCSVSDSKTDGLDEWESPNMFLSFKFPSFEDFASKYSILDDLNLDSRADFSEAEVPGCGGNLVQNVEGSTEAVPAESRVDRETERIDEEDRLSRAELLMELEGSVVFEKIPTNHLQLKFKSLSESEADLLPSDSFTDCMSSGHDFSTTNRLLDWRSSSDGFLSDADLRSSSHARESDVDDDPREELGKLEEVPEKETPHEWENEETKMEVEWEQQDLIEQLRMEIRKVKAKGLPTIDEHSESARVVDDLKPWKIDSKLHEGDRILELHKVYRTYRQKMRKFDILNYQKMHALDFLRAKDPLRSISGQKSSSAASLGTLLAQTLRLCREDKRSGHDPMMSFARELQGDLETVYVGQLCLSWEFLQWQYERALDLWEEDPYGINRYNEVADEFQLLQVMMQRFLEDEPFEGPRVQHYVKTRCFQRSLLQVPVIREDSVKMKNKRRMERKGKGKGEFGVSSDMLVEILEESIRVFWRFIRSDKDSTQKGRNPSHPQLQDLADSEVFAEVQTVLQKKEKKLEEVLKGGNCILRKFQKQHQHEQQQEDGASSSDQVLAFFSQVEMRLVRRVMNMTRLSTDQLVWCSRKLDRITFVHRRIHVEPSSFMLFPC